jgi:hypothetical protein
VHKTFGKVPSVRYGSRTVRVKRDDRAMISARLVFSIGAISGLLAVASVAGFFLTGLEILRYLVFVTVLTGAGAVFVGAYAVMTGNIKNDLK